MAPSSRPYQSRQASTRVTGLFFGAGNAGLDAHLSHPALSGRSFSDYESPHANPDGGCRNSVNRFTPTFIFQQWAIVEQWARNSSIIV